MLSVSAWSTCPQCGAPYDETSTSGAERFAELLALDHSRTEPWGSRHGLAFSAYVLQHPNDYAPDVQHGAWQMLCRVFVRGEDRQYVARDMRERHGRVAHHEDPAPPLPPARERAPFEVTIASLGIFAAAEYPLQLDAWCGATLRAYGVASLMPPLLPPSSH